MVEEGTGAGEFPRGGRGPGLGKLVSSGFCKANISKNIEIVNIEKSNK